jgi:hypothetical protein
MLDIKWVEVVYTERKLSHAGMATMIMTAYIP